MKSNIKSLGWFIRFVDKDSKAGDFYREAIKLPFIRRGDAQAAARVLFWL